MIDATQAPGAPHALGQSPSLPFGTLDTTRGSVLHHLNRFVARRGVGGSFSLLMMYTIAVLVTLLPLLVMACLGPLSLTTPSKEHPLPFLYDWNVLFMFLVSFPCLVLFIVKDQYLLSSSLRSVQLDGTVTIAEAPATTLTIRWQKLFHIANWSAQVLGSVVGLVVAYFNYVTYIQASVGFWISNGGRLLPVGYVYLYCIFLFYAFAPVYVIRNIAIAFFLRDIVANAQLRLLPLHPDKSGGLRPVAQIGLRNQYVLTLFGVNVVLLVAVSFRYLAVPTSLYGLIAAAIIAYLVLGPLVFVGPLLPFRAGMLRTKSELMSEVARRVRVELQRVRAKINKEEPITKEDEELIDRLRKIGAVIDELPVWPFDAGTWRKFLTAYVIPVVGSVGYPLAKLTFEIARARLP